MTSKKLNSKRWCEVPILPICTFVKCGSMQSSQWALIKSITAHLCENDGIVKARLCPISQPYWIRAAFWSQNSPRARIELSDWFTHVRNRVELWTSWAKWRWIPQIFIFFFFTSSVCGESSWAWEYISCSHSAEIKFKERGRWAANQPAVDTAVNEFDSTLPISVSLDLLNSISSVH